MVIFASLMWACTSSSEEVVTEEEIVVEETTALSGTYDLDIKMSNLDWLGEKVTGEHFGTINITDGSVVFADGDLSSGKATIDMSSIKVTDIEDAEMNAKLTGHLKDTDFFNVAEFPTASILITEASNGKGKADVTIKDQTHPAEFTYEISEDDVNAAVAGEIVIDRTLYGIEYKSGKFFDDLGDKMIYDDFTITFKAVVNK